MTGVWLVLLLEGNAVPQKPHHVPIAVVGPQPATAQLAGELQRGGGFRVIAAATEASAKRLVDGRKVDAIINLDTRQLQTAHAASIVVPIAAILQRTISSPPVRLHVATSDIKPLPPGDPTGLGLFFTCFAAIFGGIPAGVALTLSMKNRQPGSLAEAGVRVGLIGAYSILQSLLVAVLADAVLGYGGHQFLIIWGWGALVTAAAMGTTAAAIAALGIPGALIPIVCFQFFGVPAAPLPGPWNFEPGAFRVLGPFDPMGAGANADPQLNLLLPSVADRERVGAGAVDSGSTVASNRHRLAKRAAPGAWRPGSKKCPHRAARAQCVTTHAGEREGLRD